MDLLWKIMSLGGFRNIFFYVNALSLKSKVKTETCYGSPGAERIIRVVAVHHWTCAFSPQKPKVIDLESRNFFYEIKDLC